MVEAVAARLDRLAALVLTHVMVVLALLRVAVFPLQTLLLLVVQVVHDLAKQPEPLAAVAARPALLALQALHLLLAGCLGKAAVVAVVVLLALAVQAVLEVAALVAVAVAQHAARMLLALVVWAVLAGHWFWSIDHAAICRC